MSRCFPFRPQDFAGKSTSNEALILSIKNEKEKAILDRKKDKKPEKKDKKREKEEKKRVKEEKRIEKKKIKAATSLNENGKRKRSNDDYNQLEGGKCGKWSEDRYPRSRQEVASSEQLEKSSVTEEHGNPCCSSDSTENSAKRKRNSPAVNPPSNQNSGTVIRFKFSSQKEGNPPAPSSSPVGASPSSKSGRASDVLRKDEPKINSSSQPPTPSTSGSSASVPRNAQPKISCSSLPVIPLTSSRLASVSQKTGPKINSSNLPVTSSGSGRSASVLRKAEPKLKNQGSVSGIAAAASQKAEPKVNNVHIPVQPLQLSTPCRAAVVPRKGDPEISNSLIPSTLGSRSACVPHKAEPKISNLHAVRGYSTAGNVTTVIQRSEPKVNVSLPVKPLCTTSGNAAVVTQKVELKSNKVVSSSVGVAKISPSVPALSVPSVSLTPKQNGDEIAVVDTRKAPKALRKLVKLMNNWAPTPAAQELADNLDDDWLFGVGKESKRLKSCKEEVSPSLDVSFHLQPRAQYLSDVDVYALPFTVPF